MLLRTNTGYCAVIWYLHNQVLNNVTVTTAQSTVCVDTASKYQHKKGSTLGQRILRCESKHIVRLRDLVPMKDLEEIML